MSSETLLFIFAVVLAVIAVTGIYRKYLRSQRHQPVVKPPVIVYRGRRKTGRRTPASAYSPGRPVVYHQPPQEAPQRVGVIRWFWQNWIPEFSTEAVGAALGIVIVSVLIGSVERQEAEQARIESAIARMGSRTNAVALAAVEELRILGALQDGSLQRSNLNGADLGEADLQYSNLQDVSLWGANLENVDLDSANLQGAELINANMEGSFMCGTNFQRATLMSTNLEMANLQGAELQRVNLTEAELQGAFLLDANLERANLQDANLEGANLQGANLRGASLQNANLQGVNMQGSPDVFSLNEALELSIVRRRNSNLEGANLREARLKSANLSSTYLVRAYMRNSDLQDVVLHFADLRGADLRGVDLRGADLREAALQFSDMTGASFDANTILPDGTSWHFNTVIRRFTNPEHPNFWQPAWVTEQNE